MLPRVILLAMKGRLRGHEFEFCGKTRCVVGRACDCELHVPPDDLRASRHHCLLEIDAPSVTLYDLGSTNGTYVNGERVLSPHGAAPEEGRPLAVGDEVRVGDTALRVWLVEPATEEGEEAGRAAELCGACG